MLEQCFFQLSGKTYQILSSVVVKVSVVLGAQWGDEGKGKLVDLITGDMDMVCR